MPEEGELSGLLENAGAKIHYIDPVVFRRDALSITGAAKLLVSAPASIWKLRQLMRRERYDLVHTNTGVTVGGAIAARASRIPHIFHFREILAEFGPLLRIYEPFVSLFTTRLIFITMAVGNQFHSRTLRQKGTVIHDGIPVQDFFQTKEEPLNGSVVIASVGRLAPYKGQDILLKAIAEVYQSGLDVEVYIVGDVYPGRESYRKYLFELTADLGLSHQVHFAGFQEDVQPFLEKCNIFVLSSIREEGLGIVMLEAMAAERAVIAANSGGVGEIIINGENGVLVEPGSSRDLADAIVKLAKSPMRRQELARRGRMDVAEKFSEEEMSRQVLSLYEEMLKAHS